jgi:hypothetical protein
VKSICEGELIKHGGASNLEYLTAVQVLSGGKVKRTYADDFTTGKQLAIGGDFRSEDMIITSLFETLVHVETRQTDWKLIPGGPRVQNRRETAMPAVHRKCSLSVSLTGFLFSSGFDR